MRKNKQNSNVVAQCIVSVKDRSNNSNPTETEKSKWYFMRPENDDKKKLK